MYFIDLFLASLSLCCCVWAFSNCTEATLAVVQGLLTAAAYLVQSTCSEMEKAMAPHSSTLAWRIPGTGEPGELVTVGSHRVGQTEATR